MEWLQKGLKTIHLESFCLPICLDSRNIHVKSSSTWSTLWPYTVPLAPKLGFHDVIQGNLPGPSCGSIFSAATLHIYMQVCLAQRKPALSRKNRDVSVERHWKLMFAMLCSCMPLPCQVHLCSLGILQGRDGDKRWSCRGACHFPVKRACQALTSFFKLIMFCSLRKLVLHFLLNQCQPYLWCKAWVPAHTDMVLGPEQDLLTVQESSSITW